jgi:hypothetical protein
VCVYSIQYSVCIQCIQCVFLQGGRGVWKTPTHLKCRSVAVGDVISAHAAHAPSSARSHRPCWSLPRPPSSVRLSCSILCRCIRQLAQAFPVCAPPVRHVVYPWVATAIQGCTDRFEGVCVNRTRSLTWGAGSCAGVVRESVQHSRCW